jgi:hypothetical protein
MSISRPIDFGDFQHTPHSAGCDAQVGGERFLRWECTFLSPKDQYRSDKDFLATKNAGH